MKSMKKMFYRVTEKLSSVTEQSAADIKENVIRLKNLPILQSNFPIKKVLEDYEKYSNICFLITNIKDQERLYEYFQIKKEEIVIAVIGSKQAGFSISKIGRVVLTDQALYVHPSLIEDKKIQVIQYKNITNRIPIKDFCKYILYAPSKYNVVMFVNENGEYVLDKTSIFHVVLSKNASAISLYNMVKDIQKSLCDNSEEASRDRIHVLQWLNTKAEKELAEGCMNENTILLINHIKEEENRIKWEKLLLKNALHSLDEQTIKRQIETILNSDGTVNINSLSNAFLEMCNELLEHLRQPDYYFNDNFLKFNHITENYLVENLEEEMIEDSSNEYKLFYIFQSKKAEIFMYIAIRKNPEMDLKIIEDYLTQCGKEEIKDEVFKFVFTIRNQRMLSVFELIQKNEGMPKGGYQWTDGFGLTALHYAILLENKEKVIEIAKWMTNKKNVRKNSKEIDEILDYGVLCVFINKQEYLEDIFKFSREMQPLIENYKRMQVLLTAKKTSYILQKNGIYNIENAYQKAKNSGKYSVERFAQLEEELYEAKEKLADFRLEVESFENDIRNIEDEMYSMRKFLIAKYTETANRIRQGETPLEKNLKLIYETPNLLNKVLRSEGNAYELYLYNGIYFYLLKNVFKKSKFNKKEKSKYEENIHEKPYGEHWFSKAAYTDIKELRKEYRKLAAKYHPDNNPEGIEAFLEIQKERETILSLLKV